jgi:hypothetical protein
MFEVSRPRLRGIATSVLLAMGAFAFSGAEAATISTGGLSSGIGIDLSSHARCGNGGVLSTNVGTFSTGNGPGSGHSTCGNKGQVQVKDASSASPFGRYNPDGAAWLDSNDNPTVEWNVNIGQAFNAVSFGLTDANDQKNSFFHLAVNGATWEIATREANGSLHWLTILFDQAVTDAVITFSTALNDGFGIHKATVAPVPLPAAGWMLVSGLAGLAGLGWRRSRRAVAIA